jgi:hypothetical protein
VEKRIICIIAEVELDGGLGIARGHCVQYYGDGQSETFTTVGRSENGLLSFVREDDRRAEAIQERS